MRISTLQMGIGAAIALNIIPVTAAADDALPECARSGAFSMLIEGKPALTMGDVIDCPPEMIEIIPSVFINGQPMVHLKPAVDGDTLCTTTGSNTVTIGGQAAQRAGDADCKSMGGAQ